MGNWGKKNNVESESKGRSAKRISWAGFMAATLLGLSALTVGAIALVATSGSAATDDVVVENVAADASLAVVSEAAEQPAAAAAEDAVGGTTSVVAGSAATVEPSTAPPVIDELSESEVLALDDETVVENAAEIANSEEVGTLIAQAREDLGRDFTDEEAELLAAGIKAQYAYEQALAEGRDFTAEEQATIDEATELQTGIDPNEPTGYEVFISDGTDSDFHPGGKYALGVGVYPTTKGKILVTADWYRELIPTGHSALVIDQSSAYTALPEGVSIEANDWYEPSRYQTAFGVDVNKTNEAQEAKATDWCAQHLDKPYNYIYILPKRTDAYYCSSLVWQAYKENYNVNLDTSKWNLLGFTAIHPMELVDSSQTSLVYLQGNARTGWQTVDGKRYNIGRDGNPK